MCGQMSRRFLRSQLLRLLFDFVDTGLAPETSYRLVTRCVPEFLALACEASDGSSCNVVPRKETKSQPGSSSS
jgi:hypothetical protein